MFGIAGAALLAACGGGAAATGSSTSAVGTTASPSAATTSAAPSSQVATTSSAALTSAAQTATTSSSAATSQASSASSSATQQVSAASSAAPSKAGATTLLVMDFGLNTSDAKARWEKQKAAFLQKYPDVTIQEDFYETTLTKQSIAGKLYALPTTQGVKYPDSTWDYQDWLDAANRLNKYQNAAWTEIGGMMPSWWVIHYAGNHGQAMWQGGPTQPGACTRINYDQPETIQSYQWYQAAICKDHLSPTDDQANKLDANGYEGLFSGGKAAMQFSYDQRSYYADTVKGNFQWDWALPPVGDKQKPRIVTTIGGGIAIFTPSKVKDMAWNYLEFTNDPAYLLESVKANGARDVYSNRKVQESPAYQASSIPPSDKKLLVDAINSGRFFPEPSWEMRALKVTVPSQPKGTPAPTDCGADAQKLLTEQANVDNQALKAKGINVCA